MSSSEPLSDGAIRRMYCFGDFTLDLDSGFLRRGREEVTLRPKPFEVLTYLVEHHGRLVTKAALSKAVWADTAVMDNSLAQCVVEIRRVLGDDSQQLIRTVSRRGYMFTAPVITPAVEFLRQAGEEDEYDRLPLRSVRQSSETARFRVRPVGVMALVAAAAVAAVVLRVPGLRRNEPAATEYTPLTNFTDAAFSPALSPDGRMLAFIRGEDITTLGGKGEIYIKLLPDGQPVQLTRDGKKKMAPVFTPGVTASPTECLPS